MVGRNADDAGAQRRRSAQGWSFTGRGPYTEAHELVFKALTRLQREHQGEAAHVEEVAVASGLPPDETSELLHDLVTVHGLATELAGSDTPDMGPRFEVKPRM